MSLSWLKVPNGINIEARRWEIRVTTSQKCCHRSRSVPGEVAIVPHELWLESYHFAEEMSSQIRGTNFFVNQKPSRLQDIRPANPGDDSFERWAVGSALQVLSNLLNWEALQTRFSLRGHSGCNWASPLHMGNSSTRAGTHHIPNFATSFVLLKSRRSLKNARLSVISSFMLQQVTLVETMEILKPFSQSTLSRHSCCPQQYSTLVIRILLDSRSHTIIASLKLRSLHQSLALSYLLSPRSIPVTERETIFTCSLSAHWGVS
jgi:hypothetical protein